MLLLLMVIAFLPSSYAFVDCKTACRHCKENREHAILLEVHCAMCRECKLRRKMQQPSQTMSFSVMPMKPRQRLRKTTAAAAARMEDQQEEHKEVHQEEHAVVEEYDHDEGEYPEDCPTPPECESYEEMVTLRNTHPTTQATTAATCPPIPVCKSVHRRPRQTTHVYLEDPTQVYIHHPTYAQPVYAQTSCTPCMPMCPLPCIPYQPVTECHQVYKEPLKLTMPPTTTPPPTEIEYIPAPTEIKTQVLFQQSVNQLLLQQSAQQAAQSAGQVVKLSNKGQQESQLQQAANQAIQSANMGQQGLLLNHDGNQGIQSGNQAQQQVLLQQAANQAMQSLIQALQSSNQGQSQVLLKQPANYGQGQVLYNQVTHSGIGQSTLPSIGTTADYYYLYLGVPKNMMNKDW